MNIRQKIICDAFRSLGRAAAAFALLLFLAPSANADIVYSQAPTPNTAIFGDSSDCCISVDDFVLTSAATIDTVTWQGAMFFPVGPPNAADDFTIKFYADSGTVPGGLIGSFNVGNAARVDTGMTIVDGGGNMSTLFEHTTSLGAGIALAAGTYWIAIFNDSPSHPDGSHWFWAVDTSATVGAGIHQSTNVGVTWPQGPFPLTPVFTLEAGISINIDIKPGSDPNSINLCSGGAVPVAILGSDTFNVDDVDTEFLRFSEASIKMVGKKDPHILCSYEDVNSDGFTDLLCHYVTTDIAALDGDSTTATVNGSLYDGTAIEGTDSVNIVKDTCY